MKGPFYYHTATRVTIFDHANLGNRLRPYLQKGENERQYCDISRRVLVKKNLKKMNLFPNISKRYNFPGPDCDFDRSTNSELMIYF